MSKQIMKDVFEGSKCGEYGEKYGELARYAHTSYTDCDPPHLVEWQCSKHPNVKQCI